VGLSRVHHHGLADGVAHALMPADENFLIVTDPQFLLGHLADLADR